MADHFREYGPAPIDGEWIALVFAGDGGGHLFAIGAGGQIWRSVTASRFDDLWIFMQRQPPTSEPVRGRWGV